MYCLMISPNNFPEGDAGSVRDEAFAKIYMALNYSVYYIGMNPNEKSGVYKGICWESIYKNRTTIKDKLYNYLNYRARLKKCIDLLIKKMGMPSVIHVYDIPILGMKYLYTFCKNNKIPLLCDRVEWYSPSEFRLGPLSYQYILNRISNSLIIKNPIGVIAISTFLEKYYRDKGIMNVVRIPVIMDSLDYNRQLNNYSSGIIRIVYAGSPAKKDKIGTFINAYLELENSEKDKLSIDLYGIQENDLSVITNGKDISGIKAHGRKPRSVIIDSLNNSDFAILIRPCHLNYSKAGFPTKIVEAMMNSCSIVCNYFSDLELYLMDRENCVVVNGDSITDVKEAFKRLLALRSDEIIELKRNARVTAEDNFDYRKYIDTVKKLIEQSKRGM